MNRKIKIIYSAKCKKGEPFIVTALDRKLTTAMESIGFKFYGCGYNIDSQERDLGFERLTHEHQKG